MCQGDRSDQLQLVSSGRSAELRTGGVGESERTNFLPKWWRIGGMTMLDRWKVF